VTISLSIINDLIENYILEYSLTKTIMFKKFNKLFGSFDFNKLDVSPLSMMFVRFIGNCRFDLEELELD
jgi:hypothetical protein